ncbi:MAG: hypothetical protein ABW047_04940 [Nitrospiraceae bacterium]
MSNNIVTVFAAAVCILSYAGCSEAVKLVRDTGQGGVVTYSYRQDRGGHLGSPYRKQALNLIQTKCGAGSRIIREGEAKGYTSAGMGTIEGTEDEERGRRWGIQFECKTGGSDGQGQGKPPL